MFKVAGAVERSWLLVLLLAIPCLTASVGRANEGSQTILLMLQQRVAKDPSHADSWRLLGRLHHQAGELEAARQAFERAVQTGPQNVATHYDFGMLLRELGAPEQANFHLRRVYELAPESSYAGQLAAQGIVFAMPPPQAAAVAGAAGQDSGDLLQASYEVQSFDSSEDVEQRLWAIVPGASLIPPPQRLRAFIELGALYNSNVTLAPISRQLQNADAASAQGFFNPELEYVGLERNGNRLGALARGYFSFNQGNLADYNLASFQPGAFLERDQLLGREDLTGRLDYVYSLDLFGGERLGDRHALTSSVTSLRPDGDIVHAFWTVSFSQFDEDGSDPAVESLDGMANTIGMSRFFVRDSLWMPGFSLGGSLESVDTEGADFRYQGGSVYGDLTFAITERLNFIPEASVGYRSYGDFTGTVDRDELVWRAGGKLQWAWTERVAISAVAGYDRFASDHEMFDADRTQAGLVLTFIR